MLAEPLRGARACLSFALFSATFCAMSSAAADEPPAAPAATSQAAPNQAAPVAEGETPAAPVFVDGRKAATLRGGNIAAEFEAMVADYIEKRFGQAPSEAAE